MHRFTFLPIVICTILFSSSALARDTFKDKFKDVSPAPHRWTGFYAGINAGAVKHTMDITDNQATTFNATISEVSNPHLTGGFQAGYRRQMELSNVSSVYGIELSANFAYASFSQQYGSAFATYQLNATNELKDYLLLQLTGGIAIDKTLLFLAAGASWAEITGGMSSVIGSPFTNNFNASKEVLGTAFGVGLEYAMTDKISARFKMDVITPKVYSTSNNTGATFQIANSIVQGTFGLNYQFA